MKTGVQFTDQRSVGDELLGRFDTQHYGAKISLGYEGLIASTSLTYTANGASIRKPWGFSPSYNSIMISDFDRAGELSYRLSLSQDFSELGFDGFAVSAIYAIGDTSKSNATFTGKQREVDLNIDYRPPVKTLKNLWLRLRYGQLDRDNATNIKDVRFIVNYSSEF